MLLTNNYLELKLCDFGTAAELKSIFLRFVFVVENFFSKYDK